MPGLPGLEEGVEKDNKAAPLYFFFTHGSSWVELYYPSFLKSYNFENSVFLSGNDKFYYLKMDFFRVSHHEHVEIQNCSEWGSEVHSILNSHDFRHSRRVTTCRNCLNPSHRAIWGSRAVNMQANPDRVPLPGKYSHYLRLFLQKALLVS